MRLISEHKLYSHRKFTGFLPDTHFPPALQLEINITDIDLNDPSVEIDGRVCFTHLFPGEQKMDFNFAINKSDIINNSLFYTINTGDLVCKVLSVLNFKVPSGVNPNIKQELTGLNSRSRQNHSRQNDSRQNDSRQIRSRVFCQDILDFTKNLRALNPQNFLQLILRDLDALETFIDEGSQQAFKKWAIADQIIRLAGSGQIPLNHLDLAVERYYIPYTKTKERLGFKEIVT
jgi:hypothetical protein